MGEERAAGSRGARIATLFDRALAVRSPRARRAAFAVAAVLFVVTATAGFVGLPARDANGRPLLVVVVALVLAPMNSACNAAEYVVCARYAGLRVRAVDALRVTTLSTAANVLPLPGSALVRVGALRRQGTAYSRAASLIVAASVAWLATTSLLTGLATITAGDHARAGSVLLVAGIAGIVTAHCVAGAHRIPGGARTTVALVAVESTTVAVGALRLWLCMMALGYDVDLFQATALTFASVLASAAGVFPGGLGLREAIAASIGPLVALPAAVAAAASTIDRLLGLPVALVAAVGFAIAAPAHRDVAVDPSTPARP